MTGSGLFVSFEGIDGSGKSTQARLLAEALRGEGRDVVLTREPGGSPGAEEIRALVLQGDPDRWSAETELLLFTAARRDHLERTIRPALEAGKVVICDRFADSTRMYQGLSRGDLRAKVDALHDLMIGTEPDLTLLIDMPADIGLERSYLRLTRESAVKLAKVMSESNPKNTLAQHTIWNQEQKYEENLQKYNNARDARTSEDRFESFGLGLQQKMREGFLALSREFPNRFAVIDGNRDMYAVATDVRAALERHPA